MAVKGFPNTSNFMLHTGKLGAIEYLKSFYKELVRIGFLKEEEFSKLLEKDELKLEEGCYEINEWGIDKVK